MSTPARTPFLAVRRVAQRLVGNAGDCDGIAALAGGKAFMALGEAAAHA